MVIDVVGIFGNLLTFIVFSRKVFRNNSISTYCRALAIFDSIQFIMLPYDIARVFYGVDWSLQSDLSCQIYAYLNVAPPTIPGWILVAFSIDKLLSMRRNQIALLKKLWFQWLVIATIALISLLMYIEIAIDIRLYTVTYFYVYTVTYCDWSTLSYFKLINFFDLIESSLIPFIIMLITSIATIFMIRKSTRSVERVGKIDKQRKRRDIKFAITSITFNILFIILKLPILIFYILIGLGFPENDNLLIISAIFFYSNYSINFFVHLVSNSMFRRELLILLRFRRSNAVNSSLHSIQQPTRNALA